MYQLFSRPDCHISHCGHLRASVTERRISDAPAFLHGLRVVFACDFHVVTRTTAGDICALVKQLDRLKPDLILLGGDYADRQEDALRLFEGLAPLQAPLGCYGVLGNNDREAFTDPAPLLAAMAAAGCTALVNDSRAIPVGGGTLWIAGLDDLMYGEPDPAGLLPPTPSENSYRVLIYHEPYAVALNPDLALSGHTHGGQFNLLGLTPYCIGFERLYGRRITPQAVAGLHRIGNSRLLISKGIGASRIPLRVGVRPEIELLHFG